jgi:hypothetical protein
MSVYEADDRYFSQHSGGHYHMNRMGGVKRLSGNKSTTVQKIVSEWLLFYANATIFQLYHGENKFIFNEIKN